ncbi:MAG TPA: hypothetical protein VKB36_09915 [Vicinamibacterales bacterium]|nr:hypothetical protein [Vicinamibacterales bacterium]
MQRYLSSVAAILCLTGCATIRGWQAHDTEELLVAAGFEKQTLDGAETKLHEAANPYWVVRRLMDGVVQYAYVDPGNCRCVYIGHSKEYAQYQRLDAQRRRARERFIDYEDVWDRDGWGLW